MRRTVDIESLLFHLPMFEGLGRAQVEGLAAVTQRRSLSRGDVLFREGEVPTALYVVVFGRIALSTGGASRRRRVVELVEPGRSFGEAVLFLGRPSLVTAAAAEDSLVVMVPKDAVVQAIAGNAAFAQRVIGNLARRVETLVRQLQGYRSGSGAHRLVAWLLRRPGIADSDGAATVMLPAPKKAIAAQLHMSAEHFSRVLRELSEARLLEVHRRELRIPDTARLRAFLSTHQGLPSRAERASRARPLLGMDVTGRQPTGVLP